MLELNKRDLDIEDLAGKALRDEKILSELLEGLLSKTDVIRYNSFNVLLRISMEHPQILYPYWDYFVDLLCSRNSYSQYIAVYIIAHLTRVDTENKFEKIFNEYYSILGGNKPMTASHVAVSSGKIARYNPHLQVNITEKLLNIDEIYYGKQKELVKAYIIEAFDEYFEKAENKEEILEFVREQVQSESPKTRKAAEKFLEKWEEE
ncbi:MAG: hypothetical protein HXS54_14040 [Theionarchaea archaeon]|nr:hypothetical protein [Theionarchaea archaeon]